MSANIYGVDLGTANLKVYCKAGGTILNEKNVIAIQNKTKVYAIGDEAYDMYEKAPDNIKINFPVKFGVIADIQNMQTLFEQFIKKSKGAKHALQSGDVCIAARENPVT